MSPHFSSNQWKTDEISDILIISIFIMLFSETRVRVLCIKSRLSNKKWCVCVCVCVCAKFLAFFTPWFEPSSVSWWKFNFWNKIVFLSSPPPSRLFFNGTSSAYLRQLYAKQQNFFFLHSKHFMGMFYWKWITNTIWWKCVVITYSFMTENKREV